MRAPLLLPLVFVLACGDSTQNSDTGTPDSGDAGTVDTGPEDTGPEDSGPTWPGEPYTISVFETARINSRQSEGNFQRVNAPAEFAGGPFVEAKMILDLTSTCFPFRQWDGNLPPDGEYWPANCDAFDRNFEVYLDRDREAGDPGIELIRAITPFGGPMHIEVDVTDFANGLPGLHDVEVHITTWSDGAGRVSGSNGGWNVSMRFELTPGTPARNVLAVVPLANMSYRHNTTTASTTKTFEVPEGTTSSRVEYRVTGHGGAVTTCRGIMPGETRIVNWRAPAEEFCLRDHNIFVDGAQKDTLQPWRNDCGDLCTITQNFAGFGPTSYGGEFCLENPCGAIQSVQAPRANWCPGDVTPPFTWGFDELIQPGSHTFGFEIPGVVEGGSWRVSAVYFAFGD